MITATIACDVDNGATGRSDRAEDRGALGLASACGDTIVGSAGSDRLLGPHMGAVQPSSVGTSDRPRHRRIQAKRGLFHFEPGDLWDRRELFYVLLWRDIRVRYKQTLLGASWSLLRPLVSIVIFSVIFGGVAGIKSGTNVPYAIFAGCGVTLFTYFTSAVSGGSSSIVANAAVVTKAHVPRMLIPLVSVMAPLVDALFSIFVLAGLFAWYGVVPSKFAPLGLVFLLLTAIVAFGVSLPLSAVTVRYRDVPFAVPFVLQIWMYLSPVVYPVSLVPSRFRWLLMLNPLSGAIEWFRWSVVGGSMPRVADLLVSTSIAFALVGLGIIYFGRRESRFADVI